MFGLVVCYYNCFEKRKPLWFFRTWCGNHLFYGNKSKTVHCKIKLNGKLLLVIKSHFLYILTVKIKRNS